MRYSPTRYLTFTMESRHNTVVSKRKAEGFQPVKLKATLFLNQKKCNKESRGPPSVPSSVESFVSRGSLSVVFCSQIISHINVTQDIFFIFWCSSFLYLRDEIKRAYFVISVKAELKRVWIKKIIIFMMILDSYICHSLMTLSC